MRRRLYRSMIRLTLAVLVLSAWLPLKAQDLQAALKMTRAERFDNASDAFKSLLKKSPGDGDIYYYYGENFLQEYYSDTTNNSFREMSDSAGIFFKKGTEVDPANPLNFIGIGHIALKQSDFTKAQQNFSKAMSLLPSKANKNIVMPVEKQATVYIKLANAYIKSGVNDTAAVFGALRIAEKLDKNNYDLYIVRGDAFIFLLNDGSRAILNYNIAQSLNPKSPFAKLRVGQLWMRARNYQDALRYYQEVVKIDSTFAPAYRELGYLLSRANRNDEAEQMYKKFLYLSGGNITARIQYANILYDLKKYDKAIVQLNEIMKSDSSKNDLNRALAYCYYETGQFDKGIYYIKKFFRNAKPDKIRPSDYAYMGRLYARSKQDSVAVESLLKAYQMDTSKVELLSEAANSLVKLKKFDRAVSTLKVKIGLKRALPSDIYTLGKVYYNLKEWGKVDTTLAYFNTLQPDFVPGYLWRARALVNIDTTSKLGLAKPVYETLIEKARMDSVKNVKELMESYSYLAYYYLVQFKETKNQDFGLKSADFCKDVLALPYDAYYSEKAKILLKDLEPKLKKKE